VAKHRERKAKVVNKRKLKERRLISHSNSASATALESTSLSGIGPGGREMRPRGENMNMETASARLIFFDTSQLTLFDLVERFIPRDCQRHFGG
jgi:hypothetical protein